MTDPASPNQKSLSIPFEGDNEESPAGVFSPVRNYRWMILDLIFLMRPTQFFPIWATLVAGFLVPQLSLQSAPWFSLNFSNEFWITLLSVSLGSGAVFIYNQIEDVETDRINGKLMILNNDLVNEQVALWFGHGIAAASLFLAASVSLSLLYIYIGCGILGLVYNFYPFSLKNNPYSAILVNSLGGFLCFLAGSVTVSDSLLGLIGTAIPYGLAWGAVFALVTVPDQVGDRKTGKKTLTVARGETFTRQFAFVSTILAVGISAFNGDPIFLFAGLVSLPFYFQTLKAENGSGVFLPVKLSFVILLLGSSIFIPVFFLLNSFNFAICRLYYRFRFRLDYPSFSPVQ